MISFLFKKAKFKTTWPLHLMILPAIILVIIFGYIPMAGIVIAFEDFMPTKGFFGSRWIGLDQFIYMFNLPDVGMVIQNTVMISVLKIVFTQLAALAVALLINEVSKPFFKRVAQTVLLFPFFVSWVILGGIFSDIFAQNGIVNSVLVSLFNIKPVFFFGEGNIFRVFLVLSHVWKELGYSMIIYLAAITSINTELYESALIDGANRWKQTLHVTIPGMAPIIVLMSVLSLGNILNAGFDQIFVMYNPLLYDASDIIDTYVYRLGILSAQYSLATAVGLFKSVISAILIILSYWLADRFAHYRIF